MTKEEIKVRHLLREDVNININLTDEQRFVWYYGLFNCKYLVFKGYSEVIGALKEDHVDLGLTKEQKAFIVANSNKKVLCYLCRSWKGKPDIFACGDDDIAFTVDCFQTE
jgi:hypothetical protein